MYTATYSNKNNMEIIDLINANTALNFGIVISSFIEILSI